jgi:hypothetical protein
MPTINQLPVLSTISSGDQLPVYSPNNGDARRTSIGSLLTYFQQSFASPTLAVNLYVPATGFNITVPTPVAEQQWMLLQPASVLASGTITLPLNTGVPDGTELLITSTQEITVFSIALNGATAIFGAVTTLSSGAALRFRFYQSTNSWYNITSDIPGLTSAVQAFLATPSSANLLAAMTDETGTGSLVFANTPTLVTPIIGAATGTSLTTSGTIASTGTAGVGYATGAGGDVTQITSRTTGVTLNKTTGAITLFSAAGSATAATFTVTNSTVAATDVIILNQKSGTDLYDLMVTAVAAGSFNITFRTTGGTTTETPVFNFAVIKGVAA